MIDIFVINLPCSAERREHIAGLMRQYNLSYEVVNAIEGINLSEETITQLRTKKSSFKDAFGREISRGEFGVTLSHQTIYKKIIDNKIDGAVILEDDAAFDERLQQLMESVESIKQIFQQFDLVLLGYCRDDLDYKKDAILSFWNRLRLAKVKVGVPVQWYWSAIGYLLAKEGAIKLQQAFSQYTEPADFFTANSPAYGLRLGIISTPLVWPAKVSELSTVADRDISEYDWEEARVRLYNKKSAVRKTLTDMRGLASLKGVYRFFLNLINVLKEKAKVFSLQCASKPSKFTIENE